MKIRGWVYFLSFFILVGAIVWGLFTFVAGPKFVTIYKPSGFAKPDEVGAVVERRLFLEIKNSQIVVVGVEPYERAHWDALHGFLEVLKAETVRASPLEVLMDTAVKVEPEMLKASQISFQEQFDVLINKINSTKATTVLVTSSLYTSHLMHHGFMEELEERLSRPVLSLTFLQIARTPAGESRLKISCMGAREEGATYGQLGCLARTQSRQVQNMRKRIEAPVISMMEQTGKNDFLIYLGSSF